MGKWVLHHLSEKFQVELELNRFHEKTEAGKASQPLRKICF